MQRIDWRYRIAFVLFWFVILLMLSNLTSCTSAKKFMQSPDFAKACADSFPARDTVIETVTHYETDTVLLPADTLIHFDTVAVPGGYRIDTIRKPCLPSQIVTKYVTTVQQVVRIDSAKMRDVHNRLMFTERERNMWRDMAKRRGRLAMYLVISLAICLFGSGYIIAKKLKPM